MKTHKSIPKKVPGHAGRGLAIAALTGCLLLSGAGCSDNTISPCIDCDPYHGSGKFTRVVEEQFTVAEGAVAKVDDFAGRVIYRTGGSGTLRVVATLRAASRSDLDRIDVSMIVLEDGVEIRAENPDDLDRVSVDLEITAPADAIPEIDTGVGVIDYRGRPTGNCHFEIVAGSIEIRLPADVDVAVDLSAGVGSISLAFPVDGWVSKHPSVVQGKIGDGGGGEIYARTSVGNIYLLRW